jgi:UDP-N-acetylmuramyl pentapeptide phosphotransferase/UDP-N-acetylglucosamine-1-phosphate transferase
MLTLLASGVTAALVVLWIVRHTGNPGSLAQDQPLSGPQKFHVRPVPRIGGVGIFAGLIAAVLVLAWRDTTTAWAAGALLACSLPAFLAGLAEDLTKNVSPSRRLLFTALSALLAVWYLDAVITRTDIPGLDTLVTIPAAATAVTVFAVAGVANAVNIIDGFNGLASMCVVLMLASIGYVAFQVGDTMVLALAVAGVGAILGFFLWNFPLGLIFLGDGGAYFLGFYVAELAILLIHRNAQVSPLFVLLVCVYPIFETLFSIYRKKFLKGISPGVPDGVHLHMLLYRRIMRWAVRRNGMRRSLRARNSMTSPYLWVMCMLAVVPAVLFWDNTPVLAVFIVLFGVSYVVLYWRIVRFRTPRFLRVTRSVSNLGNAPDEPKR